MLHYEASRSIVHPYLLHRHYRKEREVYTIGRFLFFFPLLSLDEAVGESFTTSRSRYAGYSFPQPAHASMPSDWCFAFIPLPLYGVVSYTFRMR